MLERAAFMLFRTDSAESYKRYLLKLVCDSIAGQPRITVNKLKHLLRNQFLIRDEDTENAVAALSQVFKCVSLFTVPGRNVTHLNFVPSDKWREYEGALDQLEPGLRELQLQLAN